jgi:alpha-amylase/alpha-mannosidase (GH57 family)
MTSLIVHGHFYQPPRENPWTGKIEAEAGASPFHDWNERIHAECYLPNTAVPVMISGKEQLVNNYALLSFDFGPTLLSWLEQSHPETYARVLAADAESLKSRHGHGNAIAQAYNHAILPLCNERDRQTQVRWGMADFRYRFKRFPESLWLPETACNNEVLDLLIDEGLKFVILAPSQAKRIRNATDHSWLEVELNNFNTGLPYKYLHSDGSGRYLAVFFYDRQLSHDVAFGQLLRSSNELVSAFVHRSKSTPDLVNIATDGETYGHHHKFTERCLAYALEADALAHGFKVTNYGEFLAEQPPRMEVQINHGLSGEGSSWSCEHGVGRWNSDCGCQTGGDAGWNQAWRAPLRKALDYLRDQAVADFEATRGKLFSDPWVARDDSVQLVLDERAPREQFLKAHAPRSLSSDEQARALLHLEMQRHALLMYTSCGWFFNDIAGLEPIQILKYAARVIDLMGQLSLPSPRARFLELLAEAKSNRPEAGNGAEIYGRLVEPANPDASRSQVLVS